MARRQPPRGQVPPQVRRQRRPDRTPATPSRPRGRLTLAHPATTPTAGTEWRLPGTKHDTRSITRDWQLTQRLIDGVVVHEVKNVPTSYGHLTEIFRADWDVGGAMVGQIFQSVLDPGAISAWHAHARTLDRLFVTHGRMRVVLYDAREGSPTFGSVNELILGSVRPAAVIVPPTVWHGIQNIAATPSTLVNVVDHAYSYDDPDHYRLPPDSDQIPYRFDARRR